MRIGRVRVDTQTWLARFEDETAVLLHEESTHPAADALREALAEDIDFAAEGVKLAFDEVAVLAPVVNPSKIVCIGLNYVDHAAEAGAELPEEPVLFAKFPNAIIGPGDDIRYRPEHATRLDFEAELAVVIGLPSSAVSKRHALDHVFGYTGFNDISARDAQFADGQWVRGKSFDHFAPIGPAIVTGDEIPNVQGLAVRCLVNGEVMQDGNTSQMVFGIAHLVSYISTFITLLPGDVIATGTPAGVGFSRSPPRLLKDGDIVVTEIHGIGRLENRVRAV